MYNIYIYIYLISFGEVWAQSSSHGDVDVWLWRSPPLAALQTAAAVLLATGLQPMDGLQGKSWAETIDMFLSEIFLKYIDMFLMFNSERCSFLKYVPFWNMFLSEIWDTSGQYGCFLKLLFYLQPIRSPTTRGLMFFRQLPGKNSMDYDYGYQPRSAASIPDALHVARLLLDLLNQGSSSGDSYARLCPYLMKDSLPLAS